MGSACLPGSEREEESIMKNKSVLHNEYGLVVEGSREREYVRRHKKLYSNDENVQVPVPYSLYVRPVLSMIIFARIVSR